MKKTGVLIINLGSPDSPKVGDVYRYLTEFLNDPRVIDLPWLGRKILVNGIIIPFRVFNSSKAYKSLWTENGSPLIHYGKQMIEKLRPTLEPQNFHPHLAMRYGNPSIKDVVKEMQHQHYNRIIILPLFPQYASASNGSAIEEALTQINKWWVLPDIQVISDFYDLPGYIDTVVERGKEHNLDEFDHVIFSYHGLPVRHVDKVYPNRECDGHDCETEVNEDNRYCYKAQCYATTRAVASKLGLKESDYTVSFQSRLDKKWLEPFTDKVLIEQAKKGAKKLLVFSPAFVTDCLETTVEIGEEYQELFEEHGGEKIQLVESLNLHPKWIDALEGLILNA